VTATAATLVDLRRLIRQRVGVPASDDFFTDAVLTDTINLALDHITTEQYWPWDEHRDDRLTTAITGAVGVAVDYRATRSVFYVADELGYVAPADFRALTGATGTRTCGPTTPACTWPPSRRRR